ncbi:MAG TPA: peptidylprolyl isomerase [bacterium]|nr:peptidylprolyl isomerase [bacterium]HOL47216.1 peptidylprolyl isomerase [bacterium]HPQ18275.1 peptidylprolyl isomerase [bacterium]
MFGINLHSKWVKVVIWISAVVFIAIFVFGAHQAFQQRKLLIAFYVNDEAVTREEVEKKVSEKIENYRKSSDIDVDTEVIKKIRENVIDDIIYQKILLQEAKKLNIPVSKYEIFESIKSYYFVNDKGQFDVQTFQAYKEQAPAEWWSARENYIKDLILISKLRRQIIKNVKVTEEEVKKYYESAFSKIKIAQILIKPENFIKEEIAIDYYNLNKNLFVKPDKIKVRHLLIAKEDVENDTPGSVESIKINNIKRMIMNGYDFGLLIEEFSESPDAKKGGIIDYFTKDDVEEKFSNAAFTLKKFEISDIVKTSKGYHIIQMLDKADTEYETYADVKDKIKRRILSDTEWQLAKSVADEVYKKLQAGEDFKILVKQYSNANSKDSDGIVGIIPRFTIPYDYVLENLKVFEELPADLNEFNEYIFNKDITDTIFNLKKNEYSPIIVTNYGYHIIKCLEKIPADMEYYDVYKEELKSRLLQRKQSQIFKEWYENIKNSPKTKIKMVAKDLKSEEALRNYIPE